MIEVINYFKKALKTIPAMFIVLENYSFIIPLIYLSFLCFKLFLLTPLIYLNILLCVVIPRIFFRKSRNRVSNNRFIFKTFILGIFVLMLLLTLLMIVFYHPLPYTFVLIFNMIIIGAAILFV